jgi:hypothetical protein
VLLLPLAAWSFPRLLRRTTLLAAGAAVGAAVWWIMPHAGTMTRGGLPVLFGFALAWLAIKSTDSAPDAARVAFLPAVVGGFAGVALGTGLETLWADVTRLSFGGNRFEDVLFVMPAAALVGVLFFKVVPDFVRALDEDAEPTEATVKAPGQGDTFTVTCVRCATAIKVDRSMKRYRVATDRFEFSCPNCQHWMEWANPAAKPTA